MLVFGMLSAICCTSVSLLSTACLLSAISLHYVGCISTACLSAVCYLLYVYSPSVVCVMPVCLISAAIFTLPVCMLSAVYLLSICLLSVCLLALPDVYMFPVCWVTVCLFACHLSDVCLSACFIFVVQEADKQTPVYTLSTACVLFVFCLSAFGLRSVCSVPFCCLVALLPCCLADYVVAKTVDNNSTCWWQVHLF